MRLPLARNPQGEPLTNRIIATSLAILAAASLAACSGPASASSALNSTQASSSPAAVSPAATSAATPAATATATATASNSGATPTKTPTAAAGDIDEALVAFEQSRKVVTSLAMGDKQTPAMEMTRLGFDVMSYKDLKDYVFGGRTATACQIDKDPLTLVRPHPVNHGNAFTSTSTMTQAGARVSGVKVVCAGGASFGIIVGTVNAKPGDDMVDGLESHPFPDSDYFVGS